MVKRLDGTAAPGSGDVLTLPVRSVEELVRGQSSPKTKVSLSDVVVMHHTLSNNPLFNRTLPSTQRRAANVAEVFLPLRVSGEQIARIPSDHLWMTWSSVRPSGYLGKYPAAGRLPLDVLLTVIAEHFDFCTILVMAEELLAFRNVGGEPSAYFTASLFLYLVSKPELFVPGR